jgi:glycosyltransferase involved in cell wall biosynthesis
MFCGRPVVASAVGGVPELVDHDCAILVPPRDPSRLAEGLRNALERQWDEQLIAARCRRTWEDVGRETFEVCQQVMHSSRNGRGGGR